ncbi:hypothetical protein KKF34_06160 [Myxococcota bacterium]|nr:hypothetical protein [Myxococcota bacterium]MBU1383210.1 hypothetical protein [Myxococcota bacterium]MBU1496444.1 hypothetical protein [Myxococcota bacterium]
MSENYAICIEDLLFQDADKRYLMCTALGGTEKGLVIDLKGEIHWKDSETSGFEICISGDDRLILYLESSPGLPLTVSRGGRSVTAEAKKPIVLLDGDEIFSDSFHYRLHIHGRINYETEPSYFTQTPQTGKGMRTATAAALALTAMTASACTGNDTKKPEKEKIEVRDNPPKMAPQPEPEKPPQDDKNNNDMKHRNDKEGTEDISSVTVPSTRVGAVVYPPIEVRTAPPKVAPPKKPPMKPEDEEDKPMKPPKKPIKGKK